MLHWPAIQKRPLGVEQNRAYRSGPLQDHPSALEAVSLLYRPSRFSRSLIKEAARNASYSQTKTTTERAGLPSPHKTLARRVEILLGGRDELSQS